jgi:hypothetical protein
MIKAPAREGAIGSQAAGSTRMITRIVGNNFDIAHFSVVLAAISRSRPCCSGFNLFLTGMSSPICVRLISRSKTEHFVQLSQRLRLIHLIYQRRQLFN